MVGVPAFVRCVAGPSCRMICPIWNSRSFRIIHGPRTSPSASAVMLATAVRNVMYRVTFNTESHGVSGGSRWIEHQANSAFSRATTRSVPMPREPLTSTRSPGRMRASATSAASSRVATWMTASAGMPAARAASASARAPLAPNGDQQIEPGHGGRTARLTVKRIGVDAELEHLAEHGDLSRASSWTRPRCRAPGATPPDWSCTSRR